MKLHKNKSMWVKYSYLWATLILFLGSFIGHWIFAWHAYGNEQQTHDEEVVFSEYFIEVSRDTLENWQSEFLQLMWQVGGLALLFYVGSPQSKESDERNEKKIDRILNLLDKEGSEKFIKELEVKYPKG